MIDLSIVLPVYNERQTLPILLAEWSQVLTDLRIGYEFVICEDGSSDGTKEILPDLQREYPILLSQQSYRRGYGMAVIEGISMAQGEWILCIDSDGQCDPADVKKFWIDREKDVIRIGWRKKRNDVFSRKIMSSFFNVLFNILFPQNTIHDPSAPFVMFKKHMIAPYLQTDLTKMKEGFWWGFVAMCHKRSIAISECIIRHRPRMHGSTQVYHMGKIPLIAYRNIAGLLSIRFHK